jgi:hypothetical protein
MPTYRANVTDKQQTDIENAYDDSAIRIPWIDGTMKAFKSYDLQLELQAVEEPDARRFPGNIVGSHNDKPYRFETPGRA